MSLRMRKDLELSRFETYYGDVFFTQDFKESPSVVGGRKTIAKTQFYRYEGAELTDNKSYIIGTRSGVKKAARKVKKNQKAKD